MSYSKHAKVGVGAAILDQQQRVLLVLRQKSPEAKHWSLPGGKVEYMETIEDAVRREIKEELGVDIALDALLCVTNHILPEEDVHYIAPTFLAHITDGTVYNREPHSAKEVRWFAIDSLPETLALTLRNALPYILNHISQ